MRQRGRPSAASLSVVVNEGTLPDDRPQPPSELAADARVEWIAIVNRMPPTWFPRETWALLAELCEDIVLSRRIAAELDKVRAKSLSSDKAFQKFHKLTRMKLQLQQAMANIASKLRLTHRSRFDAKTAHNAEQRASRLAKPWELGRGNHQVDSGDMPRPGRGVDWAAGRAVRISETRDQEDIQQPGGDAASDPEFREKERQDGAVGVPAAGASGRPGRATE
jgi:hypothetical protein